MDERKEELGSLMELAAGAYDILCYMEKRGIYGWNANGAHWDVMVTEDLFAEMFGDVDPDDDGFRHANWNGLRIIA